MLIRDLRERVIHDESDGARDLLLENIESAPDVVRETAASMLGALWPADPKAAATLRSYAQTEPDEELRLHFAQALAMAEAYARVHDRLA
jgi:hypothetical protein